MRFAFSLGVAARTYAAKRAAYLESAEACTLGNAGDVLIGLNPAPPSSTLHALGAVYRQRRGPLC